MRIVFKPIGFVLLLVAMSVIIGIAVIQQRQLAKAHQEIAKKSVPVKTNDAPKDGLKEGVYKIQSKNSNLYLGVSSTATNPDTEAHITQQSWKDVSNQKWRFVHLPDGSLNVQNTLYGFWLDNTNAIPTAGDFVRQWYESNRTTNNAQKWQMIPQPDGSFMIRCLASNKVLEIHGASKQPGGLVYQENWMGRDEQKFLLERIAD